MTRPSKSVLSAEDAERAKALADSIRLCVKKQCLGNPWIADAGFLDRLASEPEPEISGGPYNADGSPWTGEAQADDRDARIAELERQLAEVRAGRKREIIQIAVAAEDRLRLIVALCNDGTAWTFSITDRDGWQRMEDIPAARPQGESA